MRRFFLIIKTFFANFFRDFSSNFNNAETFEDLKEKNAKSFYKNIKRSFGNNGLKAVLIAFFVIPAFTFGYALIKDDYALLRNLNYAISSEEVIETVMEEKNAKIEELEKEKAVIEAKYEQLEGNYDDLLELSNKQDEFLEKISEQVNAKPENVKPEESTN